MTIGNFIQAHVTNIDNEYYMLSCHTVQYTDGTNIRPMSVFRSLQDLSIQFVIEELDCSKKDFLDVFYMSTFKNNGKTFLEVGTKMPTGGAKEEETWCRYDICWKNCGTMEVMVKINEIKPTKEVLKWSKASEIIKQ